MNYSVQKSKKLYRKNTARSETYLRTLPCKISIRKLFDKKVNSNFAVNCFCKSLQTVYYKSEKVRTVKLRTDRLQISPLTLHEFKLLYIFSVVSI